MRRRRGWRQTSNAPDCNTHLTAVTQSSMDHTQRLTVTSSAQAHVLSLSVPHFLLRHGRTPSIAISLSCLSASISMEQLDRFSQNLLCRSPVAVARSSSGGVVLRYALPVLWMTSRLAVVGPLNMHASRSIAHLVACHRSGVRCL